MKVKNYVALGLVMLLGIMTSYAQCSIDAGEDIAITCGDSVQLYGERNWYVGFNTAQFQVRDVFFTNQQTGYTIGESGSIRKTTDGGITWQNQTSTVSSTLRSVHFVNADTGIVVGDNGIILKTINGGTNWVSQTVNGTTSEEFSDVFFTDVNTGYIVGTNGTILKTSDMGNNWTKKTSGTSSGLFSVHFPSTSTGYISSGDGIYKTTNAGENWILIPRKAVDNYSKLFFLSEAVGYVTGKNDSDPGAVYKTIDGGVNWTKLSINYGYGTDGIFFLNEKEGYVGSVGKIFKTTDGGKTWVSTHIGFMNIEAIHFPAAKVGYAIGFTMTQVKVSKYMTPESVTWSPATGLSSTTISNPLASPSSAITYKVTTVTNGCTAVDSIKITVNKLTVDAGNNETLACGGSRQLNAQSNYTGKGGLQYSWTPSTGLSSASIANPLVNVTQTTKYIVTITTPNGCSASDSVTVNVSPFTVEAGSDKNMVCGSNVHFDVPVTNYLGTGALIYSWSPANSLNASNIADPISNAITKTVYQLTVTTPNGCVAIDSITVFVDSFKVNSLGDVSLVCGGSTQFKGLTSNYTGTGVLGYSWVPATGLSNTAIEKPEAMILQNTTYRVLVTTDNGCKARDSVKVSVSALIVNAGTDKLHFCGDSAQFDNAVSNYTGTAPLIYSWLPVTGLNNAGISNPVTTASGITYTLTLSTSNGCHASDQVSVGLKKMNAPEICIVGVDSTNKNIVRWNNVSNAVDSVFIYRETTVSNSYVKIGSVAASKNTFRDVASQPDIKSTKYKISLSDKCGLESPQSAHHKTMHLAISKGIGTTWNLIWESYEGFSVSTYNIYRGTSPSNMQFLDATSGGSNQYTNYNPPPGDLYYQVEVVSPAPCSPSNLAGPIRSNAARNATVSIQEESNSFTFSVFPNPAHDVLTVKIEKINIKNGILNIYNTVGELVKTIPIEQNEQHIQVPELTDGFYTMELRSINGIAKQKLIIKR